MTMRRYVRSRGQDLVSTYMVYRKKSLPNYNLLNKSILGLVSILNHNGLVPVFFLFIPYRVRPFRTFGL